MVAADVSSLVGGETAVAARASLFGEFELADGHGTPVVLSNRRARAVLSILCLEADQPVAREQISELLWTGRFKAQAKASLRQCLLELGKALEPLGTPLLSITRERVGLNAALLRTDLGDLERALAAGRYEDATASLASIGAKPLLDGISCGEAFAAWLATRREQTDLRLQALVKLALSELADGGRKEQREHLLAAWTVRSPPVPRPAEPSFDASKSKIAVLPFRVPGSQDGPDYFADGMADELITALGQVPQLRVAGRTSSFHFRNSDLAPPALADALRVTHLIEGSVQRQGEQVRIHVHLIEGASGFERWGQRFDGTLDDLFALQESVAQAVTAAIGHTLGIAIQPPLISGLTHSKAAYDLYLQGRSLCTRVFGDGVLDKAVELLDRAVALDPEFAEAWLALAETHHNISVYTQCRDRNAAALRMADCARKAIALSAGLGYPYALLGTYEWTRNNIVGALDLAFEAYRREPGNPAVAMRLGSFLIYCGRTADAIAYVKAAVDQDPVDPRKHILLWATLFGRGELDEARHAAQRVVDLGWPSLHLAVTSAALGEHDLAIAQYQLTRSLVNTIIQPPVGSGTMTDEAMAAYWLMAAKGVCSGQEADRQTYHQVLDMMHATLHDKADLAIVGPAIFTGYPNLVFKSLGHHLTSANILSLVTLWADIDPIRRVWRHSEFIPFAQRIGMAAAWDKYGWPDLLPPPSNRA